MKTYSDQHGDRFGDRWGQVPKVDGDSWGCVVIHPPVHLEAEPRLSTAQRDVPHARHDAECHQCKTTRTFYAHIAPDPHHRAQARVTREAAQWLTTHPCWIATAHPKRNHRGVAA